MPGGIGNIGQQVADNFFELGKSVTSGVVKVGTDVASQSIEQILNAPSSVAAQQARKDEASKPSPEQEKMERQQKDKRRYNQVMAELEQYRQQKRQREMQMMQMQTNEEQQKKRQEMVKKQEKESFIQQWLKKVSSHGEQERQKE